MRGLCAMDAGGRSRTGPAESNLATSSSERHARRCHLQWLVVSAEHQQHHQPGRIEGYEPFFGFNETPFSLAPDPRFLFESASHAAALAQVAYALARREPLVVVTGELGTGKTLLCRTVLQRLERKTFLSVINDPLLGREDLLKQLLQDFGVISKDRSRQTAATRHDLIDALQSFLVSLAPLQAHAVVVIDEAQHLQPEVLEQIRLLSNIHDDRGTMLQIILVGQADLEPLLSRPEMRQFQQRVSRRFRIEPLNEDEVRQYIEHRMALARREGTAAEPAGDTFTSDAIQAVWTISGGIPRVINLVCDRALEAAFAVRRRTIDRHGDRLGGALARLGRAAGPRRGAGRRGCGRARRGGPACGAAGCGARSPVAEPPGPCRARGARRAAATRSGSSHARVPRSGRRRSGRRGHLVRRSGGEPARAAAGRNAIGAPHRHRTGCPAGHGATAGECPGRVPAATTGTPAAPETPVASTASPAASPEPAGERFEIVVASFRTDARAASVEAEVAALGLPTRRRVSDGWQQVLCGTFASRGPGRGSAAAARSRQPHRQRHRARSPLTARAHRAATSAGRGFR